MKIRLIMMALACLFMTRCATYYHMFGFTVPASSFYTAQEKEILAQTTKSIDFDYGYDAVLDLDYVYPVSPGFSQFKAGEKELSRALEGIDSTTLVSYSEKIYRLKKTVSLKMEKCRENGDWKNYTYLDKYLLPSVEHYADMIEKQALIKNRPYINEIDKRKKIIDRQMKYDIRRKRFEDIWKYDYNS